MHCFDLFITVNIIAVSISGTKQVLIDQLFHCFLADQSLTNSRVNIELTTKYVGTEMTVLTNKICTSTFQQLF